MLPVTRHGCGGLALSATKQDSLMSIRPEEFEPEADLIEALSPFRAAFAKARVKG